MWTKGKVFVFLAIIQVVLLILFGVFTRYGDSAQPNALKNQTEAGQDEIHHFYPMFQDVHVMIFIGFGFLMTFLKRYGFSSVGLNFVLAAFCLQWAALTFGFLHLEDGKIPITVSTLLGCDFCAAAVLISMGAVLGKTNVIQLVLMGAIEIVLYQVNEYIGRKLFHAADAGDSIFVHIFGAYFGLAVSRVIYNSKNVEKASPKEGSVYHSDLFAMVGTVFLWLYWPSFNGGATIDGDDQQRAVINTYFALCACCVTTFALSSLVEEETFDMVHVQNATLAGGVAVGAMADMDIKPWGAILIGMVAGTISVLGYRFITPMMHKKMGIHDTCGVHNLHGMPGIIAGVGSIVVAGIATLENYGDSLYGIFPEREHGRSAAGQAGYQAAAIGLTLAIAIVGGAATGLLMRIPLFDPPKAHQIYDDSTFWKMPEEGFPGEDLESAVENGEDKAKMAIDDGASSKI